jgi:hypothetical protein
MAPRGRFELPTFRLTAERSTIELPGNGKQALNLQYFAGLGHADGLAALDCEDAQLLLVTARAFLRLVSLECFFASTVALRRETLVLQESTTGVRPGRPVTPARADITLDLVAG